MNGNIIIVDKQGPGVLFRIMFNNVRIAEDSREKGKEKNGRSGQYGREVPSNHAETDNQWNAETPDKVLEVLKNDSMETYRLLSEKLSIQAAKRFAEEISKIGKRYDIHILKEWSKRLKEAVMSFNKHSIMDILSEFPDL